MKILSLTLIFVCFNAWSNTKMLAQIEIIGGYMPVNCDYPKSITIFEDGRMMQSNCATHSELLGTLGAKAVQNLKNYSADLTAKVLQPVTANQSPCEDASNYYHNVFNSKGQKILLYSEEVCIKKHYPNNETKIAMVQEALKGIISLTRLTYKLTK